MTDPIAVLRTSHDRFTDLVMHLEGDQVTAPSYDDEWTIADVASHLGSQAEIFGSFLDAGLAGDEPPGGDSFPPIWDKWNAMVPADQASASIEANEALVRRIEGLTPEERERFAINLFGRDADLDGFVRMRLGEHAVHTWDIAVALDPDATVAADAVDVLIDTAPGSVARAMKPVEGGGTVRVVTADPDREFGLDLDGGALLDSPPADADHRVTMPAEAFLRLVYGRLDPEHLPLEVDGDAAVLGDLREAFPGF
jgi:uncharacterized protein (TIGR03083 family)